jgi:four helix bundle suffix protein
MDGTDHIDKRNLPQQAEPATEPLIPRHGGYRNLKSFQVAQLVYDVTTAFCDAHIDRRSRTHDQMVQAARSGVQNIAEGSQASGTSKKMEMKLTSVARASLEELRLDYEDFLRQRQLAQWERTDPRRSELIARRPASLDDVHQWADWAGEQHGQNGRDGRNGHPTEQKTPSMQSTKSTSSTPSTKSIPARAGAPAETMANGALALIAVAGSLLDRQLAAQAAAFERDGGFTERLYGHRRAERDRQDPLRDNP